MQKPSVKIHHHQNKDMVVIIPFNLIKLPTVDTAKSSLHVMISLDIPDSELLEVCFQALPDYIKTASV